MTILLLTGWQNYFNPHSRTGSDGRSCYVFIGNRLISIHTPARGVTYYLSDFDHWIKISIHTPARGVTLSALNTSCLIHDISIHTPARGVTSPLWSTQKWQHHFNPHSRTGSDNLLNVLSVKENWYFNPHSRTGSDKKELVRLMMEKLFQSTLPHGE